MTSCYVLRLKRDLDYGVLGLGFPAGELFVSLPGEHPEKAYLAVPVRELIVDREGKGKARGELPRAGDERGKFLPAGVVEVLATITSWSDLEGVLNASR